MYRRRSLGSFYLFPNVLLQRLQPTICTDRTHTHNISTYRRNSINSSISRCINFVWATTSRPSTKSNSRQHAHDLQSFRSEKITDSRTSTTSTSDQHQQVEIENFTVSIDRLVVEIMFVARSRKTQAAPLLLFNFIEYGRSYVVAVLNDLMVNQYVLYQHLCQPSIPLTQELRTYSEGHLRLRPPVSPVLHRPHFP